VFLATRRSFSLTWEFVGLLGFAGFCVALPMVGKLNMSKDGGGLEIANPIDQVDRLEQQLRAAAAARTTTFVQTAQHLDGLSAKISELADLISSSPAAPPQLFAGGANALTDLGLPRFRQLVEGGTAGAEPASAVEKSPPPSRTEPSLRDILDHLPPPTVPGDPQKGRFGGQESNATRRLSAEVLPSGLQDPWRKVVLKLISTDGKPLVGDSAFFFLHDSFDPDAYRVKLPPGAMEATFETVSSGAFTAGAVADRGDTKLEVDLAISPNVSAPDWWRKL
jgi:hypothetical protein